MQARFTFFGVILATLFLTGCSNTYYSAMEKVGVHKRDIMIDRIMDAEESQQAAQQQFKSALAELSSLIHFDGGELEQKYQAVESQYEASKDAAGDVSKRIGRIENVAEALFEEWQAEIELISNPNYRRQSSAKLRDTKVRYGSLIRSMHKAEDKMAPILTALQDNTLFLKHNLNAKAIGALQGEMQSIERDVDVLIRDMNDAIAQSQQFIDLLQN
jgi:outer membrane murein-binding lipoprotein Lpp